MYCTQYLLCLLPWQHEQKHTWAWTSVTVLHKINLLQRYKTQTHLSINNDHTTHTVALHQRISATFIQSGFSLIHTFFYIFYFLILLSRFSSFSVTYKYPLNCTVALDDRRFQSHCRRLRALAFCSHDRRRLEVLRRGLEIRTANIFRDVCHASLLHRLLFTLDFRVSVFKYMRTQRDEQTTQRDAQ